MWLLALAACGDDLTPVAAPLGRSADVAIVAHQGDDLLFLQPDLYELTQRGSLTIIYITTGDHRSRPDFAHAGLLAAYTTITGHKDFACGFIALATHSVEHCRLESSNLSLVFLDYPDGGEDGGNPNSLLHLWQGDILSTRSLSIDPTTYDQRGLIDALAEAIDIAKPHSVRTLEVASTHGVDHSDHMMTGALALLAVAQSQSNPEILAFRGTPTEPEPATTIDPLYQRSAGVLVRFESTIPAAHEDWLRRRYAIGVRRQLAGSMRVGDGNCLDSNSDGSLGLIDCAVAPTIEHRTDGTLHIGQRCIQALPTGELVAGTDCSPIATHRFFFDDEGHVWLGAPPFAQPDMALRHLRCLDVEGGRPRSTLCGEGTAPTWELSQDSTVVPRPAGITLTGRSVRLADIDGDRRADLCSLEASGLRCAKGDGTGKFAASTVIAQLPVEPESLVIGDVDGDSMPDACGRTNNGILCATAASNYTLQPWTPAFARTGAATANDRSLAAVDGDNNGTADICGLAANGVVCASHSLTMFPPVRSVWPDKTAVLWPGDLDGDHRADWCVATLAGTACGLQAQAPVTTDGVPWSFAFGGTAEASPPNAALGALVDIDRDGRADLCSVRDRVIRCARSQGHGFGPSTVVATLPPGPAPVALWMGDLDGDGSADACIDEGATIRCVLSN